MSMTESMPLTHRDLCERGRVWLQNKGRCQIAFVEFTTTLGEIPDVIGLRNSGRDSVLIECKTSRSDFRRDKHKRHRKDGAKGLGSYRYYLCEPDVICVDDLPAKWGLLWASGRSVKLMAGADPRRTYWPPETDIWRWQTGIAERVIMFSALRRIKLELGSSAFQALAQRTITQRMADARQAGRSRLAEETPW